MITKPLSCILRITMA